MRGIEGKCRSEIAGLSLCGDNLSHFSRLCISLLRRTIGGDARRIGTLANEFQCESKVDHFAVPRQVKRLQRRLAGLLPRPGHVRELFSATLGVVYGYLILLVVLALTLALAYNLLRSFSLFRLVERVGAGRRQRVLSLLALSLIGFFLFAALASLVQRSRLLIRQRLVVRLRRLLACVKRRLYSCRARLPSCLAGLGEGEEEE